MRLTTAHSFVVTHVRVVGGGEARKFIVSTSIDHTIAITLLQRDAGQRSRIIMFIVILMLIVVLTWFVLFR
jgi:hypothetical protein